MKPLGSRIPGSMPQSLLAQERGLKPLGSRIPGSMPQSLLAQERGLKLFNFESKQGCKKSASPYIRAWENYCSTGTHNEVRTGWFIVAYCFTVV